MDDRKIKRQKRRAAVVSRQRIRDHVSDENIEVGYQSRGYRETEAYCVGAFQLFEHRGVFEKKLDSL